MATVAAVNELGNYACNPRGNLWFNDESSYGHKLLSKMGWKKGKGLGRKEDGIKENLKVKFKNTNSGLGFKDEPYANVANIEYESILRGLNAEYSQQKAVNGCNEDKELENKDFKQKSKIGKSRIRYHKLYYGKDVSKYSEKDMKAIFIYSSLPKENEEENPKDSGSFCNKEFENQLPKLQETYNSQLSISDYFNLKMKEKKENEQKKKFSNDPTQEKPDFECNETGDGVMVPRKRCKKRKKNSEMFINEDNIDILISEEKEKEDVTAPNKKVKLSKDSVYEDDFFSEEMLDTAACTDNQSSAPGKKRKSHRKDHFISTLTDAFPSYCSDLHSNKSSKKEEKKRRKKKKLFRNEDGEPVDTVELLSATFAKDEISINSEVVNNNNSTSGPVEAMDERSVNTDHRIKRNNKKKKKLKSFKKLKSCLKSKKEIYITKNVSFNESISYKIIDSDYESTYSLSDDTQDKIQNDLTATISKSSHEQKRDFHDDEHKDQDSSLFVLNSNNAICSESTSEAETEDCDSLSSLPPLNSSHYNSWVESQKLALKMKMYKNMLKSIKKHDILKTTNLLSIKGYGNWGF